MKTFARPDIAVPVLHDSDGAVIPYGRRWWPTGDEGPDDTYSVTLHPERFAPLQDVARALIDHLVRTYEVSRSSFGDDVHLVPVDRRAAPLALRSVTGVPVTCTAGVAADLAWFCTCDHCDEDLMVAVDRLEHEVAAVVDGGLREWLEDTGDGLFAHHSLTAPDDHETSGSSRIRDGQRETARSTYLTVPERWAPWELRSRPSSS